MAPATDFRPALIIVDFQNDFCPPTGSLAIPNGRAIAPVINHLLTLPFALRVATKDWHPKNHISFAANHPAPNNTPFDSEATISNPFNPKETQTSRLWPVHCVQDTPGADLVSELNLDLIDAIVHKGQDARVEMYSAFRAPFDDPPVSVSELGPMLREKRITHVYCVGLAFDYCVKCTAMDAKREGFETLVIKDASASVRDTSEAQSEMEAAGIKVVMSGGEDVQRISKQIIDSS